MKKIYLLFFLLSTLFYSAQITFAPKGAYWRYAFLNIPAWNGVYTYMNEGIDYVSDSLLAGDSVKVLRHRFYYNTCYNYNTIPYKYTVIKQRGDTVFFRNAKTSHTWQILINFAAPIGSGWQTTLLKANNTPVTFTYTVDSITQVQYNGLSLKRLYCGSLVLTERFGASEFLFPYRSFASGCDGYYFNKFLCYGDSEFGTVQFGTEPCSFSGSYPTLSVAALSIKSPWSCAYLPERHAIRLMTEESSAETLSINMSDLSGRHILSVQNPGDLILLPTDLSPGVYLLQFQSGQRQKQLKLLIP